MSIHELQAALRALDEAIRDDGDFDSAEVYATTRVIEAARRVAEGAGEPAAWHEASEDEYPDGPEFERECAWRDGWNACRHAMLAAAKPGEVSRG
jgi:hypothetical protein